MTIEEMIRELEKRPDAPKGVLRQIASGWRESQAKRDEIKAMQADLVTAVKQTEAYLTLLQRHAATQETTELMRAVRDDLDRL